VQTKELPEAVGGLVMLGKLGLPEILVILVIALLIFGPKRIPELGKALGDGLRGLKDGISPSSTAKPAEPKKP